MSSKKFLFAILFGLFAFSLMLPTVSFAAGSSASLLKGGYWGPLMSCNTQPKGDGSFNDPCSSLCDLVDTTQNFIYFGMTLALYMFVPILLLWGGIVMMTAHGAPDAFTKGRQIITKALTGAAIVLGSFLILNTFLWAIGSYTSERKPTDLTKNTYVSWPNIECIPANIPGGQNQAQ